MTTTQTFRQTEQESSRRQWLRQTMLSSGLLLVPGLGLAQSLPAYPANPRNQTGLAAAATASFGPLGEPDLNGIRLPAGFSSRVVARSGQVIAGTGYAWHSTPDGGCTFPAANGGWIYVGNSEVDSGKGGASSIVFDAAGNITGAYRILSGTSRNCAGGPTPWGTYLSCEEVERGKVWECDPLGKKAAVRRDALGWFYHEGCAFDTGTGHIYLTEDKTDGGLYRFVPTVRNDLSKGTLQIAKAVAITGGGYTVSWLNVPTPNPTSTTTSKQTRRQVSGASKFNGGEGIWFHQGLVYFTTKGDNRVWALNTATQRLDILYQPALDAPLTGVDNIVVNGRGDIFVAEDGGDMQVCVMRPTGEVAPILQVTGQPSSECTGIAFSPDGSRLYFSSQRGTTGSGSGGITYEIRGPFMSV